MGKGGKGRDKGGWNPLDGGVPLEYTPGYTIYIYGKGDVRIDVPSGWYITQTDTSTDLRDVPEPDTSGMIQITVFPPFPIIPGPPLMTLFRDMQQHPRHEVLSRGEIHEAKGRDLQMLWQDQRYVDDDTGRICRATTHLARGGPRHMVVTCTCWDEETERFAPIFEVVRRSIRLSDLGDALTGHRTRARDN